MTFREHRLRLEVARGEVAALEAELVDAEMHHRRLSQEARRATGRRYVDPMVRADFDRWGRRQPRPEAVPPASDPPR